MGEKVRTGRAFVQFKGDYDFDGLFKLIVNWMLERRYEFHEKKFKEKGIGPGGAELKIKLIGEKKETGYVKLYINVFIRAWDYVEKEGMLHGEHKIYSGGRIQIEIITTLEVDWQNKFSGSKSKELMGKFYYWVKKKEIELLHIDVHEYETLRLEYEVKKFLKMETDTHAFYRGN
ncbi:hypothetical protein HQ533_05490 [Candidatus Woesearchaeota archaeon]|nr:hypothetical protein [Candidatus Woesearchaeota archaeon]